MLLEHTFVTTVEGAEALRMCSALLAVHGFAAVPRPGFQVGEALLELELTRGRKSPSRAKTAMELPQQVLVQFDRGRITLAATITPRTWGGREYPPGAFMTVSSKKPQPLQQEMLLAIAEAVEQRLVAGHAPDQCLQRLGRAEQAIRDHRKRQRRKHWIALAVIVLVAGGAIALGIYSNP
jgi:hypothetical protein